MRSMCSDESYDPLGKGQGKNQLETVPNCVQEADEKQRLVKKRSMTLFKITRIFSHGQRQRKSYHEDIFF